MRSKPNSAQWIGMSASDITLTTTVARVAGMRQSLTSIAKVAKQKPAATKAKSPSSP